LLLAGFNNRPDVVEVLVNYGAGINDKQGLSSVDSQTLLHHAAANQLDL
jgi:hypothetical protein